MSRYYPVMLDLLGARCLVVGGGKVAARKVESLLECQAVVRVISPAVCPEMQALLGESAAVVWIPRGFAQGDTAGFGLVIAATDDAGTNGLVAREARDRGLLVNVVDCAPESNFIVPAAVRRGDLVVAVSTSGASPALAKQIREELEASYGEEYGSFLQLMAALRPVVIAAFPAGRPREEVFHRLAAAGIPKLIAAGDTKGIEREIANILGQAVTSFSDIIGKLIEAEAGHAHHQD